MLKQWQLVHWPLHSNRGLGLTINKPLLIHIFKTKNLASLPIIQEGIHFEEPSFYNMKKYSNPLLRKCFYCGKDNHVLKDYYKWKVDETNGVFHHNNLNKKTNVLHSSITSLVQFHNWWLDWWFKCYVTYGSYLNHICHICEFATKAICLYNWLKK